jgi:hypothetical protein
MKSHALQQNHATVAPAANARGKCNVRGLFALLAPIALLAAVAGLSSCAGVTSAASGAGASTAAPTIGILTPSLTTVAFGSILINTTSTLPVTLTNTGTVSVTISAATAAGTGYSVSGLSAGQVIAAGQNATFSVQFAPTAAGSPSGTITISGSAPASPLAIILSGTATQTQAQLTISPTSVNFNSVAVGSNNPQTITLTNTGNASLTISGSSVSGTGYSISGLSVGQIITAGGNATFTAKFTPTAEGTAVGSISISSNAPNSPATIGLTGIGTQPLVSATPTTGNLGTVVVGSSNSQSIMLSNTGNATLTISQITVTGAGYTVTGLSTATTIAALGSVTFDAIFTPATASGTVPGSIVIATNGLPAQLTIPLTGISIAATTVLGASPSSLAFGNVNLNTSTPMTTTITNTGNSNVTITGVNTVGAGFSSSGVSNGLTLTPNQTATLTVTFDPTTAGAVSGASVTIVSNAGGLAIPVSGTGTAAAQDSVSLTWTASSSSDVTGYYAYRSTTEGSGYVKLNPTSPTSTEEYTDSTVESGTTYYYVVTAVDSSDVESDYSAPATAVIP